MGKNFECREKLENIFYIPLQKIYSISFFIPRKLIAVVDYSTVEIGKIYWDLFKCANKCGHKCVL